MFHYKLYNNLNYS